MTYATLDLLTNRVGEAMLIALTDRGEVPLGVVDTDVLGRALADADAIIDGYLAARYVLPLVSTPALIADLAQAITLWKLHVTTPDDKVKADYDAAMRTLRDIAQGIIRIPDATGVDATPSGAGGVQFIDRERPFTPENLTGFI